MCLQAIIRRKQSSEKPLRLEKTVKYNGVTYKVVAFGKDEYWDSLVRGKVKRVTIPKTVRMIWDNALTDDALESISVNAANPYYTSKNGILYTKTYFTLVQYPGGKKVSRLVLPKNTHFITNHAIYTKQIGAIGKLVVNANLESVGVANWGKGPIEKNFLSLIMLMVTGELWQAPVEK